jgi:hypothetical protein
MSKARLRKRVFDIEIEHCPNCGAKKIFRACPDRYVAHVSWSITGIFIPERDDQGW